MSLMPRMRIEGYRGGPGDLGGSHSDHDEVLRQLEERRREEAAEQQADKERKQAMAILRARLASLRAALLASAAHTGLMLPRPGRESRSHR